MAFHAVSGCCEAFRKLAWALSVLSSDDVWLFGRLGDKLAERQEAERDLDLDAPVTIYVQRRASMDTILQDINCQRQTSSMCV